MLVLALCLVYFFKHFLPVYIAFLHVSGVLETLLLPPGKAVYYAWQDPVHGREFFWTTDEHFKQSNLLREVTSAYSIRWTSLLSLAVVGQALQFLP